MKTATKQSLECLLNELLNSHPEWNRDGVELEPSEGDYLLCYKFNFGISPDMSIYEIDHEASTEESRQVYEWMKLRLRVHRAQCPVCQLWFINDNPLAKEVSCTNCNAALETVITVNGDPTLGTDKLPELNCSNCDFFCMRQEVLHLSNDTPYACECSNLVHPIGDCILKGFSCHS